MSTYRWMLSSILAFSVTSVACDNEDGDDTGADPGSSGADDDSMSAEDTGEEDSGDDTGNTTEMPGESEGETPGLFETEVQPIFTASCALPACHDGTSPPVLSEGAAYAEIVGVDSPTASIPLVVAGDADGSYLYQKIIGAPGILGTRMPQVGTLDSADIAAIEAWIEAGAAE